MTPVYENYPAVDENNNFPPPVREAMASSLELTSAITQQVSSDPTVVTAAATMAQSTAGVVIEGDPRLLTVDDVPGVLWGVVDASDRQTVLMLNDNGDFTDIALSRLGTSLGLIEVDLDSNESFAVVDSNDRIIFSDTQASTPSSGSSSTALPSLDWVHYGDSMTDNAVTGPDNWVTKLSALTGRNHYNGGWYSQTAVQIAARSGGLPPIVTVAGNVTSGSGNTVITSIINKPVLASSSRFVAGKLAGIPGVIRELTSGNVTFTPDNLGVYPIPAGSIFIPSDAETYRNRTMTIWSGRNDVGPRTDIQMVIASIRAAIDYVSSDVKRVMVMEVVPSIYDSNDARAYTADLNQAIKSEFFPYWLPIASWLRSEEAASSVGITFTANDYSDIALGNSPESFRADSTHLNALGNLAVRNRVYAEAQKRGWLV
ncbi:minor tail protein [Arthrobacter phage Arcadia]|uniref:Minor tail protein n=1 Tax=Arthrobacter phage Arcadia TaxID=2024274 RepID=A0A222Z645_9CAUD|nr:tail protein [Arthrobacter phage Arcadia]ASR79982.1 minor tail protein [Arthrobacter phage Arcadia]ASR80175.1 minor tail protein [Arthrobacter phage Elsa]ASR80372.1 minor tail protein [Arthrobacter phage Nason]